MKKALLLLIFVLFTSNSYSQHYNPEIAKILETIELDSLKQTIGELSGAYPVTVDGETQSITSRIYYDKGNEISVQYMANELEDLGFEPQFQNIEVGQMTANNVYAIQESETNPEVYVIISAHIDSFNNEIMSGNFDLLGPGADDNGSGCAAVIECARILQHHNFNFSIIYAFWNLEEIGLYGSKEFIKKIALEKMDVRQVINIDMIGYCSANTQKNFLVDCSGKVQPQSLADTALVIYTLYDNDLHYVLRKKENGMSDHDAFNERGIHAISFHESLADANPFYHSEKDLIGNFNFPYYLDIVKLSIATLVECASLQNPAGVEDNNSSDLTIKNYPNPFKTTTEIQYFLPKSGRVRIDLYNEMGQKIANLRNDFEQQGKQYLMIDQSSYDLLSGIYFLRINHNGEFKTHILNCLK
jgi:peptidase M28-like protein/type IX secretion system substrate protein